MQSAWTNECAILSSPLSTKRGVSPVPSKNRGVPHISLVFREMWDTTKFHLFLTFEKTHVECCGIPHLAKNERDMGHPTILGREKGHT
jgi:hypothetical protein